MTDDEKRIEYNGRQVLASWPEEVESAQKCTHVYFVERLPRTPHQDREPCHDCAVLPGQLHVPGCDWERCPKCGEQAISCPCRGKGMIWPYRTQL